MSAAPTGRGFDAVLEAERALVPADVYTIRSMLSYEERLLLHWAARTGPPGAIVDLGSFLGGSTLALARGASERAGTVDTYDRFVLEGDWERHWLPEGFDIPLGESTLPVFADQVLARTENVRMHVGDITTMDWTHGPIGVCFIDIAKSWETADHVWRTFLPALTPGALVIQQDLVHWGHAWCAVIMEALADHFEFLGWVWFSSAVYRCRQPPERLPVPMLEQFSCEQLVELVDRAARRIGAPGSRSVRLSAVGALVAFGRFDDARARLEEVRADETELPFIEEGLTTLGSWISREQARMAGHARRRN